MGWVDEGRGFPTSGLGVLGLQGPLRQESSRGREPHRLEKILQFPLKMCQMINHPVLPFILLTTGHYLWPLPQREGRWPEGERAGGSLNTLPPRGPQIPSLPCVGRGEQRGELVSSWAHLALCLPKVLSG